MHADVYGQLAGALTGVPLRVSTKHGFNEFRENPGFALGDRAIATFAHTHIAISRGLARYLEEVEGFDGASFEIVHYGIEPDGLPRRYGGTRPVLLCVGRLIPIKGHIVLLRAFAAARRRVPDLELHVAGRGPLEPALRALAMELDLEDSVRFLGYVAPVQHAIEESAVVVVPSMGEGFGMVALEAMERARPVIAANIGGLGELVAGRGHGPSRSSRRSGAPRGSDRASCERPAACGGDGRGRPPPCARALPAGALHGSDGVALRRRSRCAFVNRKVRSVIRATLNSDSARARPCTP